MRCLGRGDERNGRCEYIRPPAVGGSGSRLGLISNLSPRPHTRNRRKMSQPIGNEPRTLRRLVRSLELGRAPDPAPLLARLGGEGRGFWGQGDRWMVWAGAVARIEDPVGGPRRFARLRESLQRVSKGLDAPLRFFGGLSFNDSGATSGIWEGFPSVRFVAPEVILSWDGARGIAQIELQRAGDEVRAMGEELTGLARWLEGGPDLADPAGAGEESLPSQGEPAFAGLDRSEERGEEGWIRAVRSALSAQEDGRLDKAVLARTRDVELPRPVSVSRLLTALRRDNPKAHVFLLEPSPGRILFGAAPEVLAELSGGRFYATAVAGSAPRGRTPHEDQLLSGGLLASEKDRAEHRMTLEEMVGALAPRLERLEVPDGPRVLALSRIQHLETPIRGVVAPGEDILGLVEALHPTPAVCGRPRGEALALIQEAEPFDRGWYAGPVGWMTTSGEGAFVPALRVGVGGGRHWRLYAGAGIVKGSDPRSEWEETALKFEPAHRALRAALDPHDRPTP
jgi:menaquinone-specific isochorismate synthase